MDMVAWMQVLFYSVLFQTAPFWKKCLAQDLFLQTNGLETEVLQTKIPRYVPHCLAFGVNVPNRLAQLDTKLNAPTNAVMPAKHCCCSMLSAQPI